MSGNIDMRNHWNRRSFMKAGMAGLAAFGPGIQLFWQDCQRRRQSGHAV